MKYFMDDTKWSIINTEKPVNPPAVNDIIPETPVNNSENKPSIDEKKLEAPLIENKPSIDEKNPEAAGNSLDNKELNKKEMIDNIKNPEKPAIIDKIPSFETINPEGPNSEIYKANILLGQKRSLFQYKKTF